MLQSGKVKKFEFAWTFSNRTPYLADFLFTDHKTLYQSIFSANYFHDTLFQLFFSTMLCLIQQQQYFSNGRFIHILKFHLTDHRYE